MKSYWSMNVRHLRSNASSSWPHNQIWVLPPFTPFPHNFLPCNSPSSSYWLSVVHPSCPSTWLRNLPRPVFTAYYRLVEIEVEVNLRPTVNRPVCPVVRRPSGTCDQFFFLFEISFRQLRLCYFVAPSLTRGRVCNLLVQLLLGLARAVTLGPKSRRTHGHILLSHLRIPQPGEPGSRTYFPQ
jgi:hypothetical protein